MPPDISKIPLPTAGQARRKSGKRLFTKENAALQGGGRKKGSITAASMMRLERMDGAAADLLRQMPPEERNAMTPLDVLEFAMRAYVAIGDVDRAAKMATELAPYRAPKLQAIANVTEDGLRALGKRDLERLIGLAEAAVVEAESE